MSYDEIIKDVGNIGNRYQLFLIFLLTIRYLKVETISYMFMTLPTNFTCNWNKSFAIKGLSYDKTCGGFCQNQTNEQCFIKLENISEAGTISCSEWVYENHNTIISEFNLVCDNEKWVNIIQVSIWVGIVCGIILGPIADRFGRRITIITASYVDIICSILLIFANGPWMFMIMKFIVGVCSVESKISLINFQELSNVESRIIAGNCYWITWSCGYCLIAIISYIFPYWKHLQIAQVLLVAVVCIQPLFIPESPRWLLVRNRYTEAQKTIDMLCRRNKVKPVSLQETKVHILSELSFLTIIRNTGVVARIIFTIISWTCIMLIYYGISLNAKFATENPYMGSFIMGIAEFPAIPIGLIMSKCLGYRISLYILVSMTSFLILIIPWIINYFILRAILAFIGKLSISAAYTLIIIYSGDLFSTGIRNTGMSFNCLTKLSGTIIPFINDLKTQHFYFPAAIYSICGILCCLIIVPFPETRGAPLIQKMSEMPDLKWKLCKQPFPKKIPTTDTDLKKNGSCNNHQTSNI